MSNYNFPLFEFMNLETQSNCNRDCWFCPRTFDTSGLYLDAEGKRILKKMPTKKIIDILDQCQDLGFKGKVSTHHLSEPLLDKRIIEIANELRNRSMLPILNTNTDILRVKDDKIKEVDEIFEHVVIGIYDLVEDDEIEEEKKYWQSKFKKAKVFYSVIQPIKAKVHKPGDGAYPRTNVPYSKEMVVEKSTYPKSPCHRPIERILIHYDGSVGLCCEDHASEFNLGNAFDTPIKDIWYSKRHMQIVKNLIEGKRELYDLCKRCTMPGTTAPRGLNDYRNIY